MSEEDVRSVLTRLLAATEPKELLNMPLRKLEEHYDSLQEVRGRLHSWGYSLVECDTRLNLIRQEIELKRAEFRHDQTMRLGGRTLFWAKVGGIAAAVGTLVLIGQELPISRLRPSRSSQASPESSPQTMSTAAESPRPPAEESPSTTPQPSQTPSPTSTPTS